MRHCRRLLEQRSVTDWQVAADHAADVETAPPAPRYEQLPAREGYIVTPGYYRYDADRREHVWVKGDYQAERRGEYFVPHRWTEQNGRYHFEEGRWEKDNKGQ